MLTTDREQHVSVLLRHTTLTCAAVEAARPCPQCDGRQPPAACAAHTALCFIATLVTLMPARAQLLRGVNNSQLARAQQWEQRDLEVTALVHPAACAAHNTLWIHRRSQCAKSC